MAKENNHFIKIKNPRIVRRSLLENARDILKVLQGYEDFKRVREARTKLINSFRTDMDDIRSLVVELRKLLPKTNVKDIKKPVRIVQETEAPHKELKRLEEELSDIEDKLSSI